MRHQPNILVLAADMIFTSKIRGAATSLGVPVAMARNAELLLAASRDLQPALVILDLDLKGLDIGGTISAVHAASPASEILAYVSHVRTDAIMLAQQSGAKVLARSAFTRSLPEILKAVPAREDPAG